MLKKNILKHWRMICVYTVWQADAMRNYLLAIFIWLMNISWLCPHAWCKWNQVTTLNRYNSLTLQRNLKDFWWVGARNGSSTCLQHSGLEPGLSTFQLISWVSLTAEPSHRPKTNIKKAKMKFKANSILAFFLLLFIILYRN